MGVEQRDAGLGEGRHRRYQLMFHRVSFKRAELRTFWLKVGVFFPILRCLLLPLFQPRTERVFFSSYRVPAGSDYREINLKKKKNLLNLPPIEHLIITETQNTTILQLEYRLRAARFLTKASFTQQCFVWKYKTLLPFWPLTPERLKLERYEDDTRTGCWVEGLERAPTSIVSEGRRRTERLSFFYL